MLTLSILSCVVGTEIFVWDDPPATMYFSNASGWRKSSSSFEAFLPSVANEVPVGCQHRFDSVDEFDRSNATNPCVYNHICS